jgi:hypothetical protein
MWIYTVQHVSKKRRIERKIQQRAILGMQGKEASTLVRSTVRSGQKHSVFPGLLDSPAARFAQHDKGIT